MPVFLIFGYSQSRTTPFARAFGMEFADRELAELHARTLWPRHTTGAVDPEEGESLPAGWVKASEQAAASKVHPPPDPLRDLIRERAKALGLTAYALAKRGEPDGPKDEAIRRYLSGRAALNSRYVSLLLEVLGWDGSVGWIDPPTTVEVK